LENVALKTMYWTLVFNKDTIRDDDAMKSLEFVARVVTVDIEFCQIN